MKRIVFLCIVLFGLHTTKAQIADRSSPLHFGAGFVIGGVGGYAANKLFKGDMKWTWAGAVGSALAAGLTKEYMDQQEYGGWDNSDVVYTTLGGVVSGLVLEMLLNKNRRRGRGKRCSCYAVNIKKHQNFKKLVVMKQGSHSITAAVEANFILASISK